MNDTTSMPEQMAALSACEAQRLSDERFRALVEMASDAIFLADSQGQIHYASPPVERVLGYPPEALLGRSGFDLVHPQDIALAEEVLQRTVAEPGEHVPFLLRARHLDGSWRWVQGVCSNHLSNPAVGAVVVNYRDVTDDRRAEQALRDSEGKYRAIFDHAVEGFFQTTPEGRFLTVNPALARMYGFESPADVVAHFDDIERELYVDARRRQEFVRLMEQQDTVKGFEFQIRRRDGSHLWVSETARAVRDENGKLRWYEGTVEDISERKQAEAALRASEEFLRMSQRVGKVGSWQWQVATGRVHWSEGMYAIYGVTPEQFDGSLACAVRWTHPDDLPAVQANIERMLASGELQPLEYRVVRPDGRLVHLWGQGEVSRAADGTPTQVVGTVMDLTERKRAEEQRRSLEAQIQHAQKLESLGVLAGGIAHDFNNLLTSMLGHASLALMRLPAESPACPMLRELENAAQRAADLTQQLLAYSGKGKFVIQDVHLDVLVREMTKLLGTVISKKAALHLELAPAALEGDATQVRQVVMNLITNASDALADRSGAIRVRTGVRQADAALLRSTLVPDELPAGPYAYVEVEDDGCGMDADTLPRIFDPFFTTKFTGRGLGLAAVLGIVRGHRGTIKVDSSPGRGTRFQVLFPSIRAAPVAVQPPVAAPAPCGQGTVLIIEDEDVVRSVARCVLEGAGCRVVEACDGEHGLDILRRRQGEIDLVLLDLTMPRRDGVETLREIRLLPCDLPVVVMSGYSEHSVSARFTGLEASGFIQKPFRPQDLLKQVGPLLPRAGRST